MGPSACRHFGDCNDDGSPNLADGIWLLNYLFLAGPSRECLAACDTDDDDNVGLLDAILLIQHWIALLATLHENGIYFRGINFSNVLVTPDQELGLIDVGSTEFKPAPLSPAMRARNFKHPLAYQVDLNLFREFGMTRLVESYLKRANLSDRDRDAFLAKAGTQHPALKSAIEELN